MANSQRDGKRNFLIKVYEGDAPDRIGVPTDAAQWEGGTFLTGKPRKEIRRQGFPVIKLPKEKTEAPRPGDRLYIWINKERHGQKTGGGKGLTATAEVAPTPADSTQGVRVVNVLLYSPIGVLNDSHLGVLQHEMFKDIVESRVSKLRYISPGDSDIIDDESGRRLIRDIKQKFPEPPAPPLPPLRVITPSSASEAATAVADSPSVSLNPDEEESVAAGSQSRLRLIEERAGQRPFREAIMKRDGGKCTVTGCRVIQALEAAHLIPYASDHQHRDNPANGILLRADIHLLFDRYLMAINPETMRIWLSDRLLDSAYARLKDKRVRTEAGLDCLRFQYDTATGRRAIPSITRSLDLTAAPSFRSYRRRLVSTAELDPDLRRDDDVGDIAN
jgi:hypothetical protein